MNRETYDTKDIALNGVLDPLGEDLLIKEGNLCLSRSRDHPYHPANVSVSTNMGKYQSGRYFFKLLKLQPRS